MIASFTDFIEAQGVSGTVEDIHLIYTYIRTGDNKVIALPNGNLANNVIVNYSKKDTRRVDFEFGISYADDYKKAEAIVLEIMTSHEKALKDPEAICRIVRHDASSITLVARVWTKAEDYWTVYFDMWEDVKKAFDKFNIEIPYQYVNVVMKDKK